MIRTENLEKSLRILNSGSRIYENPELGIENLWQNTQIQPTRQFTDCSWKNEFSGENVETFDAFVFGSPEGSFSPPSLTAVEGSSFLVQQNEVTTRNCNSHFAIFSSPPLQRPATWVNNKVRSPQAFSAIGRRPQSSNRGNSFLPPFSLCTHLNMLIRWPEWTLNSIDSTHLAAESLNETGSTRPLTCSSTYLVRTIGELLVTQQPTAITRPLTKPPLQLILTNLKKNSTNA